VLGRGASSKVNSIHAVGRGAGRPQGLQAAHRGRAAASSGFG